MTQNLLEQIATLERSRRHWKRLALVSWACLALLLLVGGALLTSQVQLTQAMADRERVAREMVEAERREAEAQRDRAEQAQQEAERAKQAQQAAKPEARQQMYHDSIERAQQAFSKRQQEASKP